MIKTGLDTVRKKWPSSLRGAKAGLLVHPASINRNLQYAVECMAKCREFEIKALFGPQHGIRGETQDNMIEWDGYLDRQTGLNVYSLYSKMRKPSPAMLNNIDVMVIDMQDVGARYYTFIWTMDLCMQACSEQGKAVVILDRPNPLGGKITEGPVLDTDFSSFVGRRSLSVRHGMTVGEIGNYLKNEYYPDLNFHVLLMNGWKRNMWFDDTDLPWVMPSPNMPTLDTAVVYPGMCLLEATNVSEGRGTTRPFEIFGAPFIKGETLVKELETRKLPGVVFRPMYFQPTFQKHAGKICEGAQMHVVNRSKFRPFKTGVAILKIIHDLYPEKFKWNNPPYEYEETKLPIDILAGTDRLRLDILNSVPLNIMEQWWEEQRIKFNRTVRKKYLMYG